MPTPFAFAPTPLPRHIAIVMDGNGRWAQARSRPRVFGHRAGAESVRRAVKACGEWGIEVLTLYAFSTENWSRPSAEVSALMALLRHYLRGEVRELDRSNVHLRVIGDLERLSAATRRELDRARRALEKNTGLTLVLALNYGGRDELARAMRALAADAVAGRIRAEAIDEAAIAGRLDTAGLPDPDLVIRTAGEMRLSNFLVWQASYAEYYSTTVCWPDFDRPALAEAIRTFQQRRRTFGRVTE